MKWSHIDEKGTLPKRWLESTLKINVTSKTTALDICSRAWGIPVKYLSVDEDGLGNIDVYYHSPHPIRNVFTVYDVDLDKSD